MFAHSKLRKSTTFILAFAFFSPLLTSCQSGIEEEISDLIVVEKNTEISQEKSEDVSQNNPDEKKDETPSKQDDERSHFPKPDLEAQKKILARKGDYYAFKNDFKAAMRAYETAWKLSKKKDANIAIKMAQLYFDKKMFASSKKYYEEADVITLTTKDKIQYIKTLQYTESDKIKQTLASLQIADYLYQYFLVSETCIHEFIRCDDAIMSYSFDYEPVARLKEALQTYSNLGLSDTTYKQALLASAFYRNEDYKALANIGEIILQSQPKYQAILKLTGYAHYEMKNYDRSLKLLEKYKETNASDTQIDYIMGMIYAEKEDFVTSNLYLNNAVLGGFQPKDIVERKLAYNYYLLGLPKNMVQVLHHLLMSETATEEDFTNAIFLAIENNDLRKAGMWIQRGRGIFPESSHILALSWWLMRLNGDTIMAKKLLEQATGIDRKNTLAYLQLGILAYLESNLEEAYKHFNRVSILDPKGIFSDEVDTYIQRISNQENSEYSGGVQNVWPQENNN